MPGRSCTALAKKTAQEHPVRFAERRRQSGRRTARHVTAIVTAAAVARRAGDLLKAPGQIEGIRALIAPPPSSAAAATPR
jgi:hypothetical protein